MSYLFLAVPNFCGSTLLHSLIETVPQVVPLVAPPWTIQRMGQGFVEGNVCALAGYRQLHGPHSMEANMEHVYSDPANYDWPYIKMVWDENWSNHNPYATIRLQKTPADIFRIPMMDPYFHDLQWIISVRNPYAYAESIMRKATFFMDPIRQLDQICHHVTRVMELQLENLTYLQGRAYVMTYEDFVNNPLKHREQLGKFCPGLELIKFDKELWVKGSKVQAIHDDSEEKLKRLISDLPNAINMINEFFQPKADIINAWGYELR